MKTTPTKQNAAASLSLSQIDALVAEIADHQLTCEGLRADLREKFRVLDERLAPMKAAARPDIERIQAALDAAEKSLAERRRVVEDWAAAHKGDYFENPRSLRLLRGTVGFRLTPPKVSALKTWTMGLCARALRRRAWGRDFLHPAKIDHEAIIRARAEFQARPERLAAVGLQITQEDMFYVDRAQEGSDAFGKEAR